MHLKHLVILIAVAILSISFLQAQPTWEWAVRSGAGGDDYGQDVVTDAQGNIYHIGYFMGNATFGSTTLSSSGGTDIYIARVGSNGIWHWAVKAGGLNNDYGRAITIDSAGNICITGDFVGSATFGSTTLTGSNYGNIFVAKLDPYGQWIWATGVPCNGYANSYDITTGNDNSIYITGAFSYSIAWGHSTTSGSDFDVFVAKLNSTGTAWNWSQSAGGQYPDYGFGIALDDYGYVYITGRFTGTANFGGTNMSCQGTADVFVSKLSTATGGWIWSRRGGQYNETVSNTICVRGSLIFVAGEFNGIATFGSYSMTTSGNYDAFAAAITNEGNWIWAIRTYGNGTEKITSMADDGSDYLYVSGYFSDSITIGTNNHSSAGYFDIFFARIYISGGWLESVKAGGSAPDYSYGIALDKAGYIFLTGAFQGYCVFRSGVTVSSVGNHDVFLARYCSFIPPEPVECLFPFAGSTGLPCKVTLSWRFIKGDKPAPTWFKIYLNGSILTNVAYTGEGVYNLPFGPSPYGYYGNWKVVPSNNGVEDSTIPTRYFSIMSQPADEDIPNLPTQAVYTESPSHTGSGAVGLYAPAIDLGWGNINTYCNYIPASSVTNHKYSILLMDKSLNPMPNPSACLVSFQLGLPQNIQTVISFSYQGTVIPNELVYWDGSTWNDITTSSGATFSQLSSWVYVNFTFTSSGRGIEEFAINQGGDSTLPVVLSSFSAIPTQQNYVQLNWTTQSETNMLGFRIYRNSTENVSDALNLNVLIPATNTSLEHQYSYLDEEITGYGIYYYWLETCDLDGQMQMNGPVSVTVNAQPENPDIPSVILDNFVHAYPNPFQPNLYLQINQKEEGILTVLVYDILGRKVAVLNDAYIAKGIKNLIWNGKDDFGRYCSTGVYFIHCKAGKRTQTIKAVLVK